MKNSILALALFGLSAQVSLAAVDCTISLSGNDQMQYDKKEIKLPAACAKADIKVTFKHIGTLPLAAMGHNVVFVGDGKLTSLQAKYAPAGADPVKLDAVNEQMLAAGEALAFTKLVGGSGEQTTVISKGKVKAGEKYQYFCAFPGHFALMTGVLEIEKAGTATAAAEKKAEKKAGDKK